MIKFLGILLVVGSVLEDWETDARMTVKFHHRYYEQFKELDCNGTFDENEFLRLELTCSDCGLWLKDYRSTDDCRKNCYTTHHIKECFNTFDLPESSLPSYRRIIESLSGRQLDF
ncbi:ion transport peptide-like [Cotesia glomerata]|uniref:ion transport peptide-like n=1 Tax=Cotesia glomerata TaxID=32391 RepID=UPI001D02B93A|nr:ion transport peptide-like [Cotesia glomerata]